MKHEPLTDERLLHLYARTRERGAAGLERPSFTTFEALAVFEELIELRSEVRHLRAELGLDIPDHSG